jgi:methanogenic corrinoid protein MtbC1
VKILVGGLPFNLFPRLHTVVGADATASDAKEALQVAEKLAAQP